MRASRFALLIALAPALLGQGLGPTAPSSVAAAEVQRVTLAGTNIIEGSQPSVIHVRIPEDVTVDMRLSPYRVKGPNRSVMLQGDGRLVGVALTSMPPVGAVPNSRFLLSGRLGTCGRSGCSPGENIVNFQWPSRYPGQDGPRRHELVAGDYRLFLLADGAPVRIRLKLQGLGGRVHISPRDPAMLDLETPRPDVAHLDGPSYFSAGGVFEAGRRGLAVSLLSLLGPKDSVYSAYGMCGRQGSVSVPIGDPAYGPYCSGAATGGWVGTWNESGRFDVTFLQGYDESDLPPADGTRTHGVWVKSHNALSRVSSQIFLLSLD